MKGEGRGSLSIFASCARTSARDFAATGSLTLSTPPNTFKTPGMSSIDFAPIAVAKQAQRLSLIPTKWRLTTSQLTPPSEAPSNWALSVPRSCGLLSARELEITESDATALLERLHTLREERWTAAEVLVAFAKRASVAQQLTNCLTGELCEAPLQEEKC